MTDERWKTVAIVLAVIVAGLGLLAVATSLPRGSGSNGPVASSQAGASSGTASFSPGASAGRSAAVPGGSPAASSAPAASASTKPSASPTVAPGAPLAQIVFSDFRLDPKADPAGLARTFTFKTNGPGDVTAKVTGKSAKGSTRFCLKVGSSTPLCRSWRTGTLTGTTASKTQTTFIVTLIGVDKTTPTVDLSLTFRAKAPSVTLSNGRFDGTAPASNGYNGMGGRVKARTGGSLATQAAWGGKPFDYSYSLVDIAEPSAGGVFPGNGTGIDRTDPVTAGRWFGFSLVNAQVGVGTTPLTMTLAWK